MDSHRNRHRQAEGYSAQRKESSDAWSEHLPDFARKDHRALRLLGYRRVQSADHQTIGPSCRGRCALIDLWNPDSLFVSMGGRTRVFWWPNPKMPTLAPAPPATHHGEQPSLQLIC